MDPGATNKTTTTLDEENDATGNNTGNNTEVDNGEDEQTPAGECMFGVRRENGDFSIYGAHRFEFD